MFTLLKALVFVNTLACALVLARVKEYENFNLPQKASASLEVPEVSYLSQKLQITKGKKSWEEKSVNAQQFLFAKEAFLSEKRDEAIKLLRQQLDSGYKRNRDNLLLRLGQLYSEKYMELSYRENELYSEKIRDFEEKKQKGIKALTPKLDNARSKKYLNSALKLFSNLEKEFPKHPQIDEIVYFIGFVEMEHGNLKKGQKYLEKVINDFPKSRKYEEAVLYLGDYYFDKVKFKEALEKFRILSRRKEGSFYHYAQYKSAWCHLNLQAQKKAVADLKFLINELEATQDKAKFNLREQALKDLVVFYGEVGDVNDAIEFFSQKQSREKAFENLRLIADILRSKALDAEAMRAYQLLLKEFPNSPDAPKYALGIAECKSRLGKSKESIEGLVTALKDYNEASEWQSSFSEPKQKEAARRAFEELVYEVEKNAYFFHSSAQKSSNKGSIESALKLYQAILESAPSYKNRKKIAFYRAEVLYSLGRWLEAADAYMIVARTPPKDKTADESAYNALLALDRLTASSEKLEKYSKDDAKAVSLEPQIISPNESKFLEVGEYYLKEYPKGSRVVEVRFRIASIYYRFHHFDKAQEMFRELALKHPRHKSATTSANIVLDIHNLKKDYDGLVTEAKAFMQAEGLGDKAFRQDLQSILGQIDFKKIESFERDNEWAKAGDSYFDFFKKDPKGALGEKSLYNAFVSYQKAGDSEKAAQTSKLFVQKFPESFYAKSLLLGFAKEQEKQYEFEEALNSYRSYVKKFPKDKESPKALYNSAVYAEVLGKNTLSLELYDEYLKNYSPSLEEKKTIAISQAKLYRNLKRYDKMAVIYRRMIKDTAKESEKVALLGELARQYEKAGKLEEKNNLVREIKSFVEANPKVKVSGPAVSYLAESRFKALDRGRTKYEEIKLKFPPEDLLYLMKRKQKALAKLATDYDRVVEVGVPEWGVASLFEKGDAFQNFVNEFRSVKIPKKYKEEERKEIETQLKQIDDKLVKPLEQTAKDTWKACARRAAEFNVVTSYSQKCFELSRDKDTIEPSGIQPQPSYWTTRWSNSNLAQK